MEKKCLNILAQKTGKMRHDSAQFQRSKSARGLEFEQEETTLSFYNHGTKRKTRRPKGRLSLACKKAGISDVFLAHAATYIRNRDCSIEAWI